MLEMIVERKLEQRGEDGIPLRTRSATRPAAASPIQRLCQRDEDPSILFTILKQLRGVAIGF